MLKAPFYNESGRLRLIINRIIQRLWKAYLTFYKDRFMIMESALSIFVGGKIQP